MAKKKEAAVCPIDFSSLKKADADKKIKELGYMKISKDLIKKYVKAYGDGNFDWAKAAYVYKDIKRDIAEVDENGHAVLKVNKDGEQTVSKIRVKTGAKTTDKKLDMSLLKKLFCEKYGLETLLPKEKTKKTFEEAFADEWK